MKVAFDGSCLADLGPRGVGRAFLNALGPYCEMADEPPVLLLPAQSPVPPIARLSIVEAPRAALPRQLALPRLLRRIGARVFHSPVAALPLLAPCPCVATAHDLPWMHGESGERTSARRRWATSLSFARADAILAPSEFTASAVRRIAGSRDKVRVVPHGIGCGGDPPSAERSGPFVAIGDSRTRKNRSRIAAAHARARAIRPGIPSLRFVGPPDDWVSEDEKRRLLGRCRAAVQCSLFEGFGLPVLEALAAGAPLLCSDIPPFREVAGDAALFVDPRDEEAIAEALLRLDEDEELRGRLSAAGPRRAALFPAKSVAEAWSALHRELSR
ncbi:MAG: glycosyltransferase family 1 protein [Planctomycetota bacterium]